MPKNLNARMKTSKTDINVDTKDSTEKDLNTLIDEDIDSLEEDEEKKFQEAVDAVKKDINFDEFYFRNIITYSFEVTPKVKATVKILSAKELQEVNTEVWNNYKEGDMSSRQFELAYAMEVISRSITTYAGKTFSEDEAKEANKSLIEFKKDYFGSIPSLILSVLYKKYMIFEKAVEQLLADEDFLKN